MTVGDRIREKRIELGLTQDELAKRMGYKGRTSVCVAETKGDNVTTTKVAKFAEALGVSTKYLMGYEENELVSSLYDAYERNAFMDSITDDELELLKRIRALESVYTPEEIKQGLEFISLYQKAIPEIQTAVQSLLKSQKHDA